MTVNLGIIGCGAATERYYVPLLKKFLKRIGNLYFVDTQIARAQGVARQVGSGEACDDYREIINRVQGVVIAIPHFLHQRVSMDFLQAGVNVLCEKPLAEDPEQVRQMVAAAKDSGVALCVNNTRRMFPNFQKIREIIHGGQIGQLQSIEYIEGSTFGWASATGFYVNPAASSKGILLDLGSHVIDTICWWLGEKPALIEYRDDSFGGPESVVRITAEVKTCRIRVLLNRLCDLDSRYRIVGEAGTVEGRPFEWGRVLQQTASGRKTTHRLQVAARNYPEFMSPVFNNFLDVLNQAAGPLVAGKDVQPSIEFIDECYRKRRRFALAGYDGLQRSAHPAEDRVLVTGASGFIGGRLAEVLYLTGRYRVKAAINRWASAARIGRFPVDIVQMDLMNPDAIADALQGVTRVVHCAKGTYEVTVKGTQNLLEAALEKGVRRFVHLSTTEVYGDVAGRIREDAPLQYTGNEYNRMKVDAEKICRDYLQKGLPIAVLRPSIVYGPFSKNWTLHLAGLMLEGKWGILDGIGEGICNLVYVDDLIEAALLALDNERAVGEAFNIVGTDVITWNQYFNRYNESLGLPPLKTILAPRANLKTILMQPVRILGGFARDHLMGPLKILAENFKFADKMMRKTEFALKATPAPDELRLYGKQAYFCAEKSAALLGFHPATNVNEGLHITAAWLKNCGFER
jgi:predicted dehydrogenase/nucleoside-diphosphate-sugar epimerase